jgi:predicted nucleic acid-binding protein
MNIYPGTSFLVALYVPDANSAEAARRIKRQPEATFLLSDLAELELANALQQRLFRKELDPAQIGAARKAFQEDVEQGVWQRTSAQAGVVYERAVRLAAKWTASLGTRTLDILHVAIALETGAVSFYTFDKRQARLARAMGLKI